MQYSISNLNAFIILISIGFSLYYYVNDNEEHKELADKNNSPAKRSGKPLLRVFGPLYTYIVWLLHLRVKWSNYGKLLKLKVPSCSWKTSSGWSNYSGKVTSLKICENKMGYRGSKIIPLKFKPNLSRTLHNTVCPPAKLGEDVNSKIGKNLEGLKLNPWFITGFTDAEGSFMLSFLKNPKIKSGWQIQSIFQIALNFFLFFLIIIKL